MLVGTLIARICTGRALKTAILALGCFASVPTPSLAATFSFSGTVTSATAFGGASVPGGITTGNLVSGLITYNPAVPDLDGSPDSGAYADPSLFVSVNVGGSTFTQSGGQITLLNYPGIDIWQTASYGTSVHTGPGLLDTTFGTLFSAASLNSPDELLSSDDLASTYPPFNLIAIAFANGGISTQTHAVDMGWDISYDITGISPVPLPAALPLFGACLGLMSFFGWRRRRMMAAVA